MPTLLTVIPVYNGERFLGATLDAVARQTRRPDRVIVQDNCSTDDTRAVFEPFAKLGFEWCPNERHVTSTENFNHALRLAAETDVLHLLTADDLIHPEFYARLMAPLETASGRALAYSAYEVIDEAGVVREKADVVNPFPVTAEGRVRDIPRGAFIASQADLRTICLPAVLMRTQRQPLPVRFRMDYIQCADAVFYAELARECVAIFEVQSVLCQYRRHAGAATSRNRRDPGAVIADEWRAMNAAAALLGHGGLRGWLALWRRRCLLAARSFVKLRQSSDQSAEYRRDIEQEARAHTGGVAWRLGQLAVLLRDALRPSAKR